MYIIVAATMMARTRTAPITPPIMAPRGAEVEGEVVVVGEELTSESEWEVVATGLVLVGLVSTGLLVGTAVSA
jgi:hypothetical protein